MTRQIIINSQDLERLKKYTSDLSLDLNINKELAREYYYKNPSLILCDAILYINRNYNNLVIPRINKLEKKFEEENVDTIKSLMDKIENIGINNFKLFWDYNHSRAVEMLKELCKYFLKSNINSLAEIKKWAKESTVEDVIGIQEIKGIGFSTYQYLRMLSGASTSKPNDSIKQAIKDAGIDIPKSNEKKLVTLMENTSKSLGIDVRVLDYAIWEKFSKKSDVIKDRDIEIPYEYEPEVYIRPNDFNDNIRKYIEKFKSCEGYIFLIDKYINKGTINSLCKAFNNSYSNVKEIKIITSVTKNLDLDFKNIFLEAKANFKMIGINLDIKVIMDREIFNQLHDRFLISKNETYNFVSYDAIKKGSLSHIAPILDKNIKEEIKKLFRNVWYDFGVKDLILYWNKIIERKERLLN